MPTPSGRRSAAALLVLLVPLLPLSTLAPAASRAGTVDATVEGAAQAGYGRLYEPARKPITGVPFTLKGFLTSDVTRPVRLQRQVGAGRFETIARTRAGRSGRFTFRGVRLGGTATLRANAPRFTGSLDNPKPAIVTEPIVVEAVSQSGRITAMPGIVQPGATPAAPEEQGYVVGQFTPARANRPVRLERRVGGRWEFVARSRQDRAGAAAFPVPPRGTYRAVTAGIRGAGPVATGTVRSRSWSPSFEDTFSGGALDSRLWVDRPAEGAESQARRTCARVDPAARSVAGGTLRLGVGLDPLRALETCAFTTERLGPGVSRYLINAQVDTRDSFSFTHGIAAARIRWQRPKGMHGGFWLLPSAGKVAGRPDLGTEMDVVEYFGDDTLDGGFGTFVQYLDAAGGDVKLASDPAESARFKPRGDDWWSSFHVFSVEWTPKYYSFRVDGRELWRERRAVSQVGQYLVLSMLTSDYELPDLTAADLSATASVDWVRVWDR